ncbi:MAG: hypothetical protein Q8876_00920 [Bacillota bacterium]|nr:hypothetical protein [Bacillota bacterium]
MDWSVFWNAFGAIGTTIGSLITAVAVVVAVVQYKQPLIKKVRITFSTAFPVYDYGLGESFYCITVSNTGIRPIIITNIYLNTGKNNLVINKLMTDIDHNNLGCHFPRELSPESSFAVYISYSELSKSFIDLLNRHEISPYQKIKVLVTDTTSGNHYCKIKTTAERIAKEKG